MKMSSALAPEITVERIRGWVSRFAVYRRPPSNADVTEWLRRFNSKAQVLAGRVLDCIKILSDTDIHTGYRKALMNLPGWHASGVKRVGRWFFVGFGGAGESGPAMLRIFREANSLTKQKYDPLFRSTVELPSLKLTSSDTVVFIDDFSGTGSQIVNAWPTIKELMASSPRVFLVLTAATENAKKNIESKTGANLTVSMLISRRENIFDDKCSCFSEGEKRIIFRYCQKADRKRPMGYGDCGLLYVLSHKTPNNSIPIIHANHRRWKGLFPRYLLEVDGAV